MFDATLLDSSPERVPVLNRWHWMGAISVGFLGGIAGYLLLPLMFSPSPQARLVESFLLGIAVMFYELMLWYVLADARHLGLNAERWSIAILMLNVVGFVAYLFYSAHKTGDWKRAALPIAYMLEAVIVCGLILVPLFSTQALPEVRRLADLFVPPPPAGPPPSTPKPVRMVKPQTTHSVMVVPLRIPVGITRVIEKPDANQIAPSNYPSVPGGVDIGLRGMGDNPVLRAMLEANRTPPPPVAPHPARVNRVTVGGKVEEAKLIFHPSPTYPNLAKMARIQGAVVLEAVIGRDGMIQDLRAISGHPILLPAAVDAVSRWRYQPTLLNGEPVEVVTDITVNFILDAQ